MARRCTLPFELWRVSTTPAGSGAAERKSACNPCWFSALDGWYSTLPFWRTAWGFCHASYSSRSGAGWLAHPWSVAGPRWTASFGPGIGCPRKPIGLLSGSRTGAGLDQGLSVVEQLGGTRHAGIFAVGRIGDLFDVVPGLLRSAAPPPCAESRLAAFGSWCTSLAAGAAPVMTMGSGRSGAGTVIGGGGAGADADSAAVPDSVSGIVSEAGGVPLTRRYATCADPETLPMANPATRAVVRRGYRAADAADVVAEPASLPAVRGTSPILMQLALSSFVVSHPGCLPHTYPPRTRSVPSEGVKVSPAVGTERPEESCFQVWMVNRGRRPPRWVTWLRRRRLSRCLGHAGRPRARRRRAGWTPARRRALRGGGVRVRRGTPGVGGPRVLGRAG